MTKEWLDSDDATSDHRATYTTPVYLTPQPTQAQAGAVDDTALIQQLVEALESVAGAMPFPVARQVLKVARARLEGKA